MKSVLQVALFAFALAMVAPFAGAGDFESDTDGPWVIVDTVDLVSYGDATYLDYLGKGYVPLLEKVKSEGLILDYGVMMKVTGAAGDGDVVIWWSLKSMADYEKVGERMGEIAGEMHTGDEWQVIWKKLEEVRTLRGTEFYRAVEWSPVEDSE